MHPSSACASAGQLDSRGSRAEIALPSQHREKAPESRFYAGSAAFLVGWWWFPRPSDVIGFSRKALKDWKDLLAAHGLKT
jgi:hypothetical protein